MQENSREYAAALFELVEETGEEATALEGLSTVGEVFAETAGLSDFLSCPAIPMQERLDTLRTGFAEQVPEAVCSFLLLLCEQGELALLPEITEEFRRLYQQKFRQVEAKVTTAVPLTEAERTRLRQGLEKKWRAQVSLTCQVDPTLLGGLRVETENVLLDGSLLRRLKSVREEVMGE